MDAQFFTMYDQKVFCMSVYLLNRSYVLRTNVNKRNNRIDGYGRCLLKRSCKSLQPRGAAGVTVGKICRFYYCCPLSGRGADFKRPIYKCSFAYINATRWGFKNRSLSRARGRERHQKQHVPLCEERPSGKSPVNCTPRSVHARLPGFRMKIAVLEC